MLARASVSVQLTAQFVLQSNTANFMNLAMLIMLTYVIRSEALIKNRRLSISLHCHIKMPSVGCATEGTR